LFKIVDARMNLVLCVTQLPKNKRQPRERLSRSSVNPGWLSGRPPGGHRHSRSDSAIRASLIPAWRSANIAIGVEQPHLVAVTAPLPLNAIGAS
jgi:hypothetical protein